MRGLTLVKNLIHVSFVTNVLLTTTQENTMREFTQRKDPLSANIAKRNLPVRVQRTDMKEHIQMRSHTNASFVHNLLAEIV